MVLLGSITFLLILNVYIFNFSQYGYNLKPAPAAAAVSATYAETWNASEIAMTQCLDYGNFWYSYMFSYYYLTTVKTGPGWVSGRSGSANGSYPWWYYCCWWYYYYYYSNSNNGGSHLDPHAFVTKWSVDGVLSK